MKSKMSTVLLALVFIMTIFITGCDKDETRSSYSDGYQEGYDQAVADIAKGMGKVTGWDFLYGYSEQQGELKMGIYLEPNGIMNGVFHGAEKRFNEYL